MADEFTKAALYGIKTFNKKVKEKIGMQKLLDLLNEYEFKVADTYNYAEREATEDDLERLSERIISKKYGFIKCLVENDKIDTSKANDKNLNGYEIELRIRAVKELVADSEEKTVLYLNLLMLLAIQDEPIRFLCEVLK